MITNYAKVLQVLTESKVQFIVIGGVAANLLGSRLPLHILPPFLAGFNQLRSQREHVILLAPPLADRLITS